MSLGRTRHHDTTTGPHEVVVGTIGATTTRIGLTAHAEFDPGAYPTGVTIPDEVMVGPDRPRLARHLELHPAARAARTATGAALLSDLPQVLSVTVGELG
jgi:hypothetical protein